MLSNLSGLFRAGAVSTLPASAALRCCPPHEQHLGACLRIPTSRFNRMYSAQCGLWWKFWHQDIHPEKKGDAWKVSDALNQALAGCAVCTGFGSTSGTPKAVFWGAERDVPRSLFMWSLCPVHVPCGRGVQVRRAQKLCSTSTLIIHFPVTQI